jgi:hypothetical protein
MSVKWHENTHTIGEYTLWFREVGDTYIGVLHYKDSDQKAVKSWSLEALNITQEDLDANKLKKAEMVVNKYLAEANPSREKSATPIRARQTKAASSSSKSNSSEEPTEKTKKIVKEHLPKDSPSSSRETTPSKATPTKKLINSPKHASDSSKSSEEISFDPFAKEPVNRTQRSKHSSSSSTDSDDSLEEVPNRVRFARDTKVHPIHTTVSIAENQNIKGGELIRIVHNKVRQAYNDILAQARQELEVQTGGVIHITNRWNDWLVSLGGWKDMMPSREIKSLFTGNRYTSCRFKGAKVYDNPHIFKIANGRIHLPKDFSIGRIKVTECAGKTDLAYNDIGILLTELVKGLSKERISDSDLAVIQLRALIGVREYPEKWNGIEPELKTQLLHFLDYVNCLMFGMEASGLNAALIINLMTLDLIVGGRLTYADMCKQNEFGGFYTYSIFAQKEGDNKGTYESRETIISQDKSSMKEFRVANTPSPVAVKEAIVIKEWLKFKNVPEKDMKREDVLKRIGGLIDELVQNIQPDVNE